MLSSNGHTEASMPAMCSAANALTCGAKVSAGAATAGAAAGAASICLPAWAAAAAPALSAKCWVLSGAHGSSALKSHRRGASCANLSACLA